jgi:hypothetical protein
VSQIDVRFTGASETSLAGRLEPLLLLRLAPFDEFPMLAMRAQPVQQVAVLPVVAGLDVGQRLRVGIVSPARIVRDHRPGE